MDVITTLVGILMIPMVIILILGLFNRWLPESIGCKTFSWHFAPKEQGFDGCSFNGRCPRCGKEVMQDSQGNWF